ncbi:MAG: NADH-quinone oxidoreductase subunit J [Anaerolineales bacterium]|jgi:NADH-quinone oxidoreductase subunit J|nr:NADH-quinone oxidoreductase subunit J [Anaerolineales bacterium]
MNSDLLIFIPLALIALISGLGMLLSRNAIYSAINLIVNFGTVAVFYLVLGAPFIALAQVTVYAGAIMVLFLFVIMLLGVEQVRGENKVTWQERLTLIAGVALLAESAFVIFSLPNDGSNYAAAPQGFGSTTAVGLELFNQYLLPFEITSVLLLVAMVGAIVLSRRQKVRKPDRQP